MSMSATPSMSSAAHPASGSDHAQMTIFKKLYPEEYLRRHLDEGIREDGRALDVPRDVSVAAGIISHAQGSALVRLGQGTMVTAAVQVQTAKPHYDRPHEGFLVPSIDLSPLCSPQYKVGPPGDEAQVMAHYLQMFLNMSGILPRTSLCIAPGELCWSVHVDMVCLSDDGGVLDAAALAAVAALHDCRLPSVVSGTEDGRPIFDATTTQKLALVGMPILSSFGLYDSTYLLADTTAFEQALSAGCLHIGLGAEDKDAFWIKALGRSAVTQPRPWQGKDLVEACVQLAQKRVPQMQKLIRDALLHRDTQAVQA